MAERPQDTLADELAEVLRALSDRQLQLLAVVRNLRAELSGSVPAVPHAEPSQAAAIAPARTPLPPHINSMDDVLVGSPAPSVAPVVPVPQTPPTKNPDPSALAPERQSPPQDDPGAPALRTKRDYDYFEELDVQLARLDEDTDFEEP